MRVLFQDETRFGRISDRRRCWVPFPDRAVVGQQVIREFVYVMGAVNPYEGGLTSLIMPWVDTETMSIFLAHVAADYGSDFCLMFLDGAGWHRANELRIPPNMKLLFFPPYSPELNPVEHVWKHLKEHRFGNQVFTSLDEVETFLCLALRDLSHQPDLIHSITCFDWLNTLCMTAN